MTLKDLYKMLTAILDVNEFKMDDDAQTIQISLPLNWSQITDLKKTILASLGNPHTPTRGWENDPEHWGYKIDSHYLEIDEKTIKVDETGRLFCDVEDLIDHDIIQEHVINRILADDDALQAIADKILSKLVVMIPPVQPEECCPPGHHPGHHHHDPHHEDEE
jgi:hypothetical protein